MWECMCHTDVAACTNDRYLGLHEKDNCIPYKRKGCMFFGFVFLGLVAIVVIVILIRIE